MQSNGVATENGGGFEVSKVKVAVTNGKHVNSDEAIKNEWLSPVVEKKPVRQLTKMESDIVRLMGQHLREMGYQ